MANKLLPCPFCGGEAILEKWLVRGYEPSVYYEVKCSKCGQTNQHGRFDNVYKSEQWARRKAIKAWNTRPNPWHTGTPTEQGWYLLHYPKAEEQPYELAQWNGEHFIAVKPFHAIIVRIEAISVPYWQKIEEESNGRLQSTSTAD